MHNEDRYQAELASTEISAFTARFLTWGFVAILFAISLVQFVVGPWRIPELGRKPKDFEANLESASIAKAFFQPRLQLLITRWGGYGNDNSVLGRDGWLFYQPGLDYVAGSSIVDSKQIATTTKRLVDKQGAHNPEPDPRTAILQLAEDCRRLGVRLIVMPIPDKAMLQPLQATRLFPGAAAVPNNRGFKEFVTRLQEQGLEVLDPTPLEIPRPTPLYLRQDTHWTPEFMEDTARMLARFVNPVAAPAEGKVIQEQHVSRVGDLVDMLRLPGRQGVFLPQGVVTHAVIPWRPDPNAEVLLLGDSFVNIYSQPALGWGESAGFAEHLSYELGSPLDVIAQNGGGVNGTRGELARPENGARLASKKTLIYEFAMRDLLGHDWKVIPLASGKGVIEAHSLTLVARILKTSKVPQPGSAPYTDCLTFIELQVERVESGEYRDSILLAAFWGMRNNEWLPAAHYAPGDRLQLSVIPFKEADTRARTVQRADDTGDFERQPYFVVSATPQKR